MGVYWVIYMYKGSNRFRKATKVWNSIPIISTQAVCLSNIYDPHALKIRVWKYCMLHFVHMLPLWNCDTKEKERSDEIFSTFFMQYCMKMTGLWPPYFHLLIIQSWDSVSPSYFQYHLLLQYCLWKFDTTSICLYLQFHKMYVWFTVLRNYFPLQCVLWQ